MGIIDTPAFKEAVLEQRTIIRKKNMSESAGSTPGFDAGVTELLTEIRDLLKEVKNRMK